MTVHICFVAEIWSVMISCKDCIIVIVISLLRNAHFIKNVQTSFSYALHLITEFSDGSSVTKIIDYSAQNLCASRAFCSAAWMLSAVTSSNIRIGKLFILARSLR